ncbi:MAG: type II toxin-antitoxin system YafQ family toxin [Bacteroidales bacterium]|nr:type II toxin-antitoxin system YafQ family toxin [Bacteroidales bacterium]
MKNLQPTTQYRKDLKRFKHQPQKLAELNKILKLLSNEQPIPNEYQPHLLTGNYKGCLECHFEGDFLQIWIDEKRDIIELVRLGSHSEFFGKN